MKYYNYILILKIIILIISPLETFSSEKPLLKVAASTTQIADFARSIGGNDIEVITVLAPGTDPHTYQPTPGDLKAILEVDICFQNGLHLEGKDWMKTLCTDAKKQVITTTNGITHIVIEEGAQKINDPHAWFSIPNVVIYINNITKALIKTRPELKANFSSRAKLYLEQLRALDQWMKEVFSQIPTEQRVLITSHDAFNYFCRTYKFNEKYNYLSMAPVGWSTGAEVGGGMTPKRRNQVVSSIKKFNVKSIFIETTVNPKLIRSIAKDAGVKIGGSLYSDSMGAKGTAGENYIGMMRENALIIINALK